MECQCFACGLNARESEASSPHGDRAEIGVAPRRAEKSDVLDSNVNQSYRAI